LPSAAISSSSTVSGAILRRTIRFIRQLDFLGVLRL
jgi:hypothetical protein